MGIEIALRSKRLFLRWSVIVSLTLVGLIIAASLGWFGIVWQSDITRLSVVIGGVFVLATAWCGVLCWRIDRRAGNLTREGRSVFVKEIENDAENGWFAAGLCEKLGLTGTVFGFVIMLIGGFSSLGAGDPVAMQQLLERLSIGMSTAFITTLVGIVASVLLSLQYHLLARTIERLKS